MKKKINLEKEIKITSNCNEILYKNETSCQCYDNNNIPSITSINPLTRTTSSFQFIIGGTIVTKKPVFVKCLIPTITYNRLII